jgi:hypothetical protein
MRYLFDAELWRWAARAELWTFVALPRDASDEIREIAGDLAGGFGSLPVSARIGRSSWRTSIFPEAQRGYVLPVKAAVRRAEGLDLGDEVTVEVELRL